MVASESGALMADTLSVFLLRHSLECHSPTSFVSDQVTGAESAKVNFGED